MIKNIIKQELEAAITRLEQSRAQLVQEAERKAISEKVLPYNREIDEKRDNAIVELKNNLEKDINNLHAEFAVKRKALIDAGENKKETYKAATISAETSALVYKYDNEIAKLKAQIKDLGE